MIRQALMALIYGDMIMLLNNQIEPYEVVPGSSKEKITKWVNYLTHEFSLGKGLSYKDMKKNLKNMVTDFDSIEKEKKDKIKVGIVGEIYIKYSALGNNHLEKFLLEQNCEIMVPGVLGFMLFKTDNRMEDIKLYGGNPIKYKVVSTLFNYIAKLEAAMIEILR
ncbi:hypothetical protein SDC9_161434 [bioreactor metagenome]|uniref:Uncharacterized protein n=2 Tax=root TaxID=1 RepID=A0A645FI80_9ZZZZ